VKTNSESKPYLIPWDAWHENEHFISQPVPTYGKELNFPGSWDVRMFGINHVPATHVEGIAESLENPIGTRPLAIMARETQSVAIAVDDLTRPACLQPVMDLLLGTLETAGIDRRQIRIIFGVGVHGPVQGEDIIKKLGRNATTGIEIVCHDARGEATLVSLRNGKSVTINHSFATSDLKITISTVTPHLYAGYSGGAKMVVPGLSGIENILQTHKSVLMGLSGKLRQIEGNRFRQQIEVAAKALGVDFSVQLVINSERQIAGVFAGDIVSAHRAAVQYAEKIYATQFPRDLDTVILNAYPKDTELLQLENAFIAYRNANNLVKEDGVVVVTAACRKGMGQHGLFGAGMLLYNTPQPFRFLGNRHLIVYAPGVTEEEFYSLFWSKYSFYNQWQGVIDELQKHYSGSCAVGIIPCAPLQVPSH
jgi:nickel-dependent lactate racemase